MVPTFNALIQALQEYGSWSCAGDIFVRKGRSTFSIRNSSNGLVPVVGPRFTSGLSVLALALALVKRSQEGFIQNLGLKLRAPNTEGLVPLIHFSAFSFLNRHSTARLVIDWTRILRRVLNIVVCFQKSLISRLLLQIKVIAENPPPWCNPQAKRLV